MYNYGFPATYQPLQQYIPQQTQRSIHGFDWVIGSQGANAYVVPAGKTYVLFDATPDSDHFYLKSSDATGKPFPAIMFDYCPHTDDKPERPEVDMSGFATKEDINELKAGLLTIESVKEVFDQMIDDRFSQLSSTGTKTRKKETAE